MKTAGVIKMSKLTKKERLLHSLIGIKQLFNNLGVEDLKNEIVLKDGTTETIDCYKEIETFVVDFINNEVDEATPKNPILVMHGKVKMTAKEMFEELGWKKVYESQCSIIYERGFRTCSFIKKNEKEVAVDSSGHISMNMLKAINQQCKELGWI